MCNGKGIRQENATEAKLQTQDVKLVSVYFYPGEELGYSNAADKVSNAHPTLPNIRKKKI